MLKTKTIKSLLLSCLLLTGFIVSAQSTLTQNPVWTLPQWYGKMQPLGYPVPIPQFTVGVYASPEGDNTVSNYAHNSVSNAASKPLFFVADGYVMDSAGTMIDKLSWTKHVHRQISTVCYGSSTTGNIIGGGGIFDQIAGFSEACMVQNPANCKQWYIFTVGSVRNDINYDFTLNGGTPLDVYTFYPYQSYPFYALLDLGSTNGNGTPGVLSSFSESDDVVTGYNINCTPTTISYSVGTTNNNTKEIFTLIYDNTQPTKANGFYYASTDNITSGGSTYKLVFACDGDSIYTLKVTGTGTTPVTRVQQTGSHHGHGLPYGSYNHGFRAEMEVVKLNSGNYRVAVPYTGTSGFGIHTTDYTNAGVEVSSTNFDIILGSGSPTPYPHGLEFSPKGDTIYFTHETNTTYPDKINYKVVATGTTSTVSSISSVPSISDLSLSQIELNYQSAVPFLYLADSTNLVSYNLNTHAWTTNAVTISSPYYKKSYPSFYYGAPGGNSFKTYLLPDQIDGGYYPGSTGADPNCCIFYNSYDKMTYTATTAYSGSTVQVWKPNSGGVQHNPFHPATNTSSTVTIGEELRIPAGYTVTIQNMTIKFTPQATLVVEGLNGSTAGANLVLKKCTLDVDTRCAQKMWPGVRVWGDKTISRGYGNQGYIYIDSMSVIQNARIGVELGYSTDDALYDASNVPAPATGFNAGGGLIKTINSSFINNERAIVYRAYPNTGGITSLLTTTFSTTATLIETGVSPRYFIGELSYSPNTLIQGCAFGATNYLAQDTGIYTLNSVYSMSQYTGNIWNTISNMNFGVWSTNSSGSNNMSIKQTKFLNNLTGAYIGGITNPTLDTDTFKLYNCTGMFCLSSKSIGVFLDNCTGYKMQKSYFDQYATGSRTLYGLIISNSGANVNCAFSNTFKNLTRGIQMQYVNYIYQTPTPHNAGGGLVNVCNTFTNISGADMYVPSYTATANVSLNAGYSYTCTTCYSGIHADQGTNDTGPMGYPVTQGNTFSHTSGGWDVWIDSASLVYNSDFRYCSSGCSANKFPAHRKYASVTAIATDVNCATDPYSNGLRISNPVLAILAAADQAKAVYDSLQNAIASMNPNSNQLPELRSRLGNTLNRRHRLIDDGIHMLLDDRNDTTMHYVDSLSWLKAMDLPARSRLETAINIKDSSKAVTALNAVVNEEGQNDYVKVYTILLKNLHKTPAEIMANPSNLSAMQEVDANKTDVNAYVRANILLHSVGRSTYTPIVQEVGQANDEQQRVTKQNVIEEINTLISKPNPFKDYTTIRTLITRKINNAFVVITDMLGKEIAKYPVYEGETNINFDASTFNQQIFSCSLIIDGVKIQTNKMVLIK